MPKGLVSAYIYGLNKNGSWIPEKRKVSEQIILNASETNISSWTSDGVDVSNYNTAFIIAKITEFSTVNGDERLILELESSYNNSDWFHRYTFVDEENAGDNVTVTGDPDRGKIKTTGDYYAIFNNLGSYLRVKGTLSGSLPSVTLSVMGNFR